MTFCPCIEAALVTAEIVPAKGSHPRVMFLVLVLVHDGGDSSDSPGDRIAAMQARPVVLRFFHAVSR